MRRIFGKKQQAPPAPSLGETAQRLEGKSAHIEKEISDLNVKIAQLSKEMKIPGNKGRVPQLKRQALQYLKRRKLLEGQLAKVEGQRYNVDQLAFDQDQIQTNIDSFNAIKATNDQLKHTLKASKISIEGVDDAILDYEDVRDECNEISDLLSGNLGGEYIDEDELEAEFNAMADDFDMEADTPEPATGATAPPAFYPQQNNL